MKRALRERGEVVREWLQYAADDLAAARSLLESRRRVSARLIAFHAQQAAEKWLKAYLIEHEVDFPFTHDIGKLLDLCADFGVWPVRQDAARILSDYAVSKRYPGESEAPTRRDARKAAVLAEKLGDAVEAALKSEGRFPKRTRA